MPKFTWSFTAINTFLTCPAQYAAKYFYKLVLFQENEAAKWGTRVHAAGEEYMKTGNILDPEGFAPVNQFYPFLRRVAEEIKAEQLVEFECAVTPLWKPTTWWADDVCGRAKLDLVQIKDDSAIIYDLKTGKPKTDELQLKLFCVMLAIARPDVHNFHAEFLWTQTGTKTGLKKMVSRKELLPWLNELNGTINQIREAWDTETFPDRKNGLCAKWCDVVACKHNGRK